MHPSTTAMLVSFDSDAGSPIVLVVGNVVGELVGPLTGDEVGVGLRLKDGNQIV